MLSFLSPAGTSPQSYDRLVNEFGRYGLWVSRSVWPAESGPTASAAAEIEALGYGSVWIGGSPPDDLLLVEAILAATDNLVVGTSIVDIWRSNPAKLSASHARIRRQFPGRFYLGVGSGHAPTAESLGQKYVRPLSRLREFIEGLTEVPQDELMLAALGPKTLEAARDVSAGALPYLINPAHTADARRTLGPDRLLIPEQKVYVGADPATARAAGRKILAHYLELPNYVNNLRRYGFTEVDLTPPGSDQLVDELIVWGGDEAIHAGIDAHFDAGADHIAIQALPSTSDERSLPLAEWRALAKLLIS
jgi:probable F420-dependent oxidoreductase